MSFALGVLSMSSTTIASTRNNFLLRYKVSGVAGVGGQRFYRLYSSNTVMHLDLTA